MKAIALLKEVLASLGKFSISGDFTKADCLLNVFQFITCEVGFVERDVGCQLSVSVVGWLLSVVGCRLSVVGWRLSVGGCGLSVSVVGCRLSVVGCLLWVIVQLVIVFNGGFNPTTCYSQNGIHR
jgi:hypothetical protein